VFLIRPERVRVPENSGSTRTAGVFKQKAVVGGEVAEDNKKAAPVQ
jgi:hypothetical protein